MPQRIYMAIDLKSFYASVELSLIHISGYLATQINRLALGTKED